ncbi:MAG: hypothetical protein HY021_00625 [Burkholderiales bacterium]|nr:hypothetical protein [Burkholderiales bacterium]
MSRPARNLLLIIGDGFTGLEWVSKVNGCTEADLNELLRLGLIEPSSTPPPPVAPPPEAQVTLDQALGEFGYRALYDLLTSQARPRLGLASGYRMILNIEKCPDVEALRALVPDFIEQVRKKQGDVEARAFCRELGVRP